MIKVLLDPAEIAERVVADLRAEGLTEYPFIPADLDEEIVRWCHLKGVEHVPGSLIREAMASLPGVKRIRPWLNARDPQHHYIRRRQRARGEENERPTIYLIQLET